MRACLNRESNQCPVYRTSEEKALLIDWRTITRTRCAGLAGKMSESRFRWVWFLVRNGEKLEEESNLAEGTVQEKSVKNQEDVKYLDDGGEEEEEEKV